MVSNLIIAAKTKITKIQKTQNMMSLEDCTLRVGNQLIKLQTQDEAGKIYNMFQYRWNNFIQFLHAPGCLEYYVIYMK